MSRSVRGLLVVMIAMQPWWLAGYGFSYLLGQSLALAPGLLQQRLFDALLAPGHQTELVWWLLAGILGVGIAAVITEAASELSSANFRGLISGGVRRNAVAELMSRPGATGLPVSVGEALTRLNNDALELADFPLWLPHVAVHVAAGAVAVGMMVRVSPSMTLVVLAPALGLIVLSRLAWGRLLYYRQAAREAGDESVTFIREALSATQALKLAGAVERVVKRFDLLNRRRRDTETRDVAFERLLQSGLTLAVEYGFASMLLLSGPALAAGQMTVGQFAMFAYYLGYVTHLPQIIGMFMGDCRQQQVAVDRLAQVVSPASELVLLRRMGAAERAAVGATTAGGSQGPCLLRVAGLRSAMAGGRALVGADIEVGRGTLTIVAGAVGSGKTTLLRALLGLVPAEGQWHWSGCPVADPARELLPPRCAYVPQVPRLLSATLRENILLGLIPEVGQLERALCLAGLAGDLAQLDAGLETMVGPRGMRLSGGQLQRAALARALVRRPQLLVLDDATSAVDAGTEQAIWQGLRAETGLTCLAASNSRQALLAADQIILLQDGRVAGSGGLSELLAVSEEMHRLWEGQAGDGSSGRRRVNLA